MERFIGQLSLLVRDYDEALDFYINTLGFELVTDTVLTPQKRWVVIKPANTQNQGCQLLLARAADARQEACIGNQSGGRVWLFLYTDDFERDYDLLQRKGVTIVRPPSQEVYGRVLVFQDLYGNLWDLIEPVQHSGK